MSPLEDLKPNGLALPILQTWAGHASLILTLDRFGHLLAPHGRDQFADAERRLFGGALVLAVFAAVSAVKRSVSA
jgi:hypothetical protein